MGEGRVDLEEYLYLIEKKRVVGYDMEAKREIGDVEVGGEEVKTRGVYVGERVGGSVVVRDIRNKERVLKEECEWYDLSSKAVLLRSKGEYRMIDLGSKKERRFILGVGRTGDICLSGDRVFMIDRENVRVIEEGEERVFRNTLDIDGEGSGKYRVLCKKNWGPYKRFFVIGNCNSIDFIYFVETEKYAGIGEIGEDRENIQLPFGKRIREIYQMGSEGVDISGEDGRALHAGCSVLLVFTDESYLVYDGYLKESSEALLSDRIMKEVQDSPRPILADTSPVGGFLASPPDSSPLARNSLAGNSGAGTECSARVIARIRSIRSNLLEVGDRLKGFKEVPVLSSSIKRSIEGRKMNVDQLIFMIKEEEIKLRESLREEDGAKSKALIELLRRRIEESKREIESYREAESKSRQIDFINKKMSFLSKRVGLRPSKQIDLNEVTVYTEPLKRVTSFVRRIEVDTGARPGSSSNRMEEIEEYIRSMEDKEIKEPIIEHVFDDEISREFIQRLNLEVKPKTQGVPKPAPSQQPSIPASRPGLYKPHAEDIELAQAGALGRERLGKTGLQTASTPNPAPSPSLLSPTFSIPAPSPNPSTSGPTSRDSQGSAEVNRTGPSLPPKTQSTPSSLFLQNAPSPTSQHNPLFQGGNNTLSLLGNSSRILRGNPSLSLGSSGKKELGSLFKQNGGGFLDQKKE
jgi:hypothetical protein